MSRLYSSAIWANVGIVLFVTAASPQQHFTVTSERRCTKCTISLTHVVSIEGNDSLRFGGTRFIRRDSHGNYYATSLFEPGVIIVFDATGHIIEKIGASNAGHMQFGVLGALLVGNADTVRMVDVERGQYVVVAPSREVVRVAPFPGILVTNSYGLLPNGDVVLNAYMLDPQRVGFPFHVINSHGEYVRSFGPSNFSSPRQNRRNSERRIATDSDGGVWAAFHAHYLLEHWTVDGKQDLVLERSVPWFPPNQADILLTPERRPVARVNAVSTDRNGRVWIIAKVADSRWAEGLQELENGLFFAVQPTRVWDSVIEVIDPVTRLLVASEKLDQHIIGFVDKQHVYSYRFLNVDGTMGYDVWRVEIISN